mmetsp:Transcript_18717/g.24115  ORF Transcript_18717/g.24115 Transcript_18717/m.24115 type:complete len:1378 (+) Transcript_18717:63-4196(+)
MIQHHPKIHPKNSDLSTIEYQSMVIESGTMNATVNDDLRKVYFSGDPADSGSQKFCNNSIKTSKYNLASFLPVSLLEQFRRQGNQYFLLMSILMLIGFYFEQVFQTPIQPWTTLGPLIVVLAISMLQEGYADYKRHVADDEVNNRLVRVTNLHQDQVTMAVSDQSEQLASSTQVPKNRRHSGVLSGFQGKSVKWKNLSCGNLVVLKNGDELPADLVLIATSEAEGIAYIETSQIDGETNLKLRRAAVPEHQGLTYFDPQDPSSSPEDLLKAVSNDLKSFKGTVQGEQPNPRINSYEGNLLIEGVSSTHNPLPGEDMGVPAESLQGTGSAKIPLGIENVMLRGSSLRNTSWAIGITIFTGRETKVVLNSRKAPSKLSEIDRAINRAIQIIFVSDIILTLISASLNKMWESEYFDKSEYLGYGSGDKPADGRLFWENLDWQQDQFEYYKGFLTFLVLYNNFIPISMYVTVEIVVFILLYYVNNDKDMYHEETDTAAKARSSNITDLGQIQYIFSDKTGTLTQNVMRFKRCSVEGKVYGEPLDSSEVTPGESGRVQSEKGPEDAWEKLEMLSLEGDEVSVNGETKTNEPELGAVSARSQVSGNMNGETKMEEPELGVESVSSQETFNTDEGKGSFLKMIGLGSRGEGGSPRAKKERETDSIQEEPNQPQLITKMSQASDDFLKILCLCNTVVVEKDKDGKKDPNTGQIALAYQAESPDEAALVDAAKDLHYELKGRTTQDITAIIHGKEVTYSILAVNKFDSYRKRMSIVLEDKKDKRRWLLCKGADTAMLGEGCVDFDLCPKEDLTQLQQHLDMFAGEGLRTLVCGTKEIDDAQWTAWNKNYQDALTALHDRDQKVSQAADEIEKNMKIIGATAIEDKLQDGVPDTIADLAVAGIKLWVLTGDKRQTAINIGFSCKVLRDNMQIETLEQGSEEHVRKQLCGLFKTFVGQKQIPTSSLAQCFSQASCGLYKPSWLNRGADVSQRLEEYNPDKEYEKDTNKELALILEGPGLIHILGDDALEWMLFQVASQCNTVIACRVSPKQKALLVRMVKTYISPTPVTLAIGDGANDVNMIQEAQVGIGISGNEGQQAVNSSDFAIAQFRFLKPLLLIHGRWNYRRVAKVVLYSLCKNLVLVETLFFFGLFNGFSGTALYDQYLISLFNFFLGLPIIAVGIFDRDIPKETALEHPGCYYIGMKNKDMTVLKILEWIITALIHGFLVFWGSKVLFSGSGVNNAYDLATFGTLAFAVLIITMNYKVALEHRSIILPACRCTEKDEAFRSCCSSFGWSMFFWLLSVFGFFLALMFYSVVDTFEPANYLGVGIYAFSLPIQWLYLILIPTVALFIEIIYRYIKADYQDLAARKDPQHPSKTRSADQGVQNA